MDFYPTSNGASVPREFEHMTTEANTGFDNWLQDYLTEVLPTPPGLAVAGHGSVQAMPDSLSPDIFDRPSIDADMANAGHDIASSNSGDYSNEQHLSAAKDAKHNLGAEDDKAAQRAAKIADKNRKAQKRFREREKQKKQTLESQVAELTAKLSQLSNEKSRLENRNNILEKVVRLKDEYITELESKSQQDTVPSVQRTLNDALCDFYKVVKVGKRPKYGGTDSAIPMSAIQSTHKAYIDALANCLMEGAEDPSTPAHARMCELIRAMRVVMSRIALLNDKLYMTVSSQQVLPGEKPAGGKADMQHWRTVLDAVHLSTSQKEAVLAARHELLTRMSSIVAERQPIVACLQELTDLTETEDYSKQFEKRQAIERLQNNLKEEYRAVFDFDVAFFQTVLTALQQARMQVASYPWPIDSLAICALIAEDMGDASAAAHHAQADYAILLTRLPEKSPFRALAAPMPVG